MSLALTASRPRYRLRRNFAKAATAALGVVVVFWTLIPVYNMLLIALSEDGDEFTGTIWPSDPSLESFQAIWLESNRYLEGFWHQFGNSIYLGVTTMVLTVLVGSLASFAMGRMRFRKAWLIGNFSLITYAVPASFLVISFTRLMHVYGLTDNILAVVAAEVAFATPYAILIFHQYGKLIPLELDEAARVDGASPWQVYLLIYLPLMAPALAAVATYALLLAWNEYLYQFLLLSSPRSMTVAAAIDQVLRQRRGTMELHDGHRHRLFAAADCGVLRTSPIHGRGADDGWREGVAGPITARTRTIAPRPPPCRSPARAARRAKPSHDRSR
jgi:multiple sugar transport system permease protein